MEAGRLIQIALLSTTDIYGMVFLVPNMSLLILIEELNFYDTTKRKQVRAQAMAQ